MAETFKRGYAVVVGVGADLPVTVGDASGIANLLRDPAHCAYPADHVQLLTSESARRVDILTALDTLAAQTASDPDVTAIVYFSGHGLETPGYYLMPFGYDLADLTGTAIAGAEFTERLRVIRAKKLLVLLDCCHAGGIGEVKGTTFAKSPAPPGLFNSLGIGSGRVILASSRKDEVSYTGKPYSVFTGALLEALAGYGAFEYDGYARVLDATMWLGRKVPDRTGDKQHPIIKVSNLEDNFALAYYSAGDKQPKRLEWTASVPGVSPGLDVAQVEAWRRMLRNYRENLLLIEERMSEYVEFIAIPLQLVRSKRQTEAKIAELEQKLGLNA
jgi:uncharacterized caspase-like protein